MRMSDRARTDSITQATVSEVGSYLENLLTDDYDGCIMYELVNL